MLVLLLFFVVVVVVDVVVVAAVVVVGGVVVVVVGVVHRVRPIVRLTQSMRSYFRRFGSHKRDSNCVPPTNNL